MSHDQLNQIRTSLGELRGKIDLIVEYQYGDEESFVYARDIVTTFVGLAVIRSEPNTFVGVPTFGLFVAAAAPIDIEVIAKAFDDAGIEFSRMHKDLSAHLPRNEKPPNLYIFVGLKPPPPLISPAIPPKPRLEAPKLE